MLDWIKAVPRDKARDALRRGLQSALAALATYVLIRVLGLDESYIAILGAVLILQPSVGGTVGVALTRLQATLVGSLLGLACLLLLPDGWGTPAALAVSMLVVGGAAGLRSDWSYGAVAAVGVALAPEGATLDTAIMRGVALALGAAIGVLVSLLVWPDRAEVRFGRHFRAALRATATRLSDAVEATMEPDHEAAPPGQVSAYHQAVGLAQEALDVAKFVDRRGMQRQLGALARLYNSIIILDRAAEAETPPVAGVERLHEQVEALRRRACEVLTALATGDWEPGDRIGDIDAVLAKLQAALADDDPSTDLHWNRSAVAFGLIEVRRTLAELIEAFQVSRTDGGDRSG